MVKQAQDAQSKAADRYTRAAEICKRQAESAVGGDQDGLHELAKVAPFSIRGIDLSTDEGREEAMDHLELYCDELLTALEAIGARVENWRGAKHSLAEASMTA